jgi:hypothetical protein
VEGWHNYFNALLNSAHPSIWIFINALKKENNINQFKVEQFVSGILLPEKKNTKILRFELKNCFGFWSKFNQSSRLFKRNSCKFSIAKLNFYFIIITIFNFLNIIRINLLRNTCLRVYLIITIYYDNFQLIYL